MEILKTNIKRENQISCSIWKYSCHVATTHCPPGLKTVFENTNLAHEYSKTVDSVMKVKQDVEINEIYGCRQIS